MSELNTVISRFVRDSDLFNTLSETSVDLFFQKSPTYPSGDKRGVKDLEYQVIGTDGSITQNGKTTDDGKITIRVRGGQATLQLLAAGAAVSTYLIKIDNDAWEAKDSTKGVQRRLRSLGFHLGHTGPDTDGIDNTVNQPTDAAIMHFQVDNNLPLTGVFDAANQNQLNTLAGGTAAST
jgi:peptidoglycan hydrolase-like protein with peptidoglycan-binding domain